MRHRLAIYPSAETLAKAWKDAIASIRDPKDCPMYDGLEIGIVDGLFPIGRDPESELWEFVHLRSGGIPERDSERRLKVSDNTGLLLVLLPGGTFVMGSPEDSKYHRRDEHQHDVTLSPFLIAKYEVRQVVWERVTGSNPAGFKGESFPVETINWPDCQEFCKKLGLSVPSEAQWEYACRAGTRGPHYGSGVFGEIAWYKDNSGHTSHPVGKKKPNAFGLHDMHGNLWEYCHDWYDPDFYTKPEATVPDPVNASGRRGKVVRGGDWNAPAKACTSAIRWVYGWLDRHLVVGLRPAMPLHAPTDQFASSGLKVRNSTN